MLTGSSSAVIGDYIREIDRMLRRALHVFLPVGPNAAIFGTRSCVLLTTQHRRRTEAAECENTTQCVSSSGEKQKLEKGGKGSLANLAFAFRKMAKDPHSVQTKKNAADLANRLQAKEEKNDDEDLVSNEAPSEASNKNGSSRRPDQRALRVPVRSNDVSHLFFKTLSAVKEKNATTSDSALLLGLMEASRQMAHDVNLLLAYLIVIGERMVAFDEELFAGGRCRLSNSEIRFGSPETVTQLVTYLERHKITSSKAKELGADLFPFNAAISRRLSWCASEFTKVPQGLDVVRSTLRYGDIYNRPAFETIMDTCSLKIRHLSFADTPWTSLLMILSLDRSSVLESLSSSSTLGVDQPLISPEALATYRHRFTTSLRLLALKTGLGGNGQELISATGRPSSCSSSRAAGDNVAELLGNVDVANSRLRGVSMFHLLLHLQSAREFLDETAVYALLPFIHREAQAVGTNFDISGNMLLFVSFWVDKVLLSSDSGRHVSGIIIALATAISNATKLEMSCLSETRLYQFAEGLGNIEARAPPEIGQEAFRALASAKYQLLQHPIVQANGSVVAKASPVVLSSLAPPRYVNVEERKKNPSLADAWDTFAWFAYRLITRGLQSKKTRNLRTLEMLCRLVDSGWIGEDGHFPKDVREGIKRNPAFKHGKHEKRQLELMRNLVVRELNQFRRQKQAELSGCPVMTDGLSGIETKILEMFTPKPGAAEKRSQQRAVPGSREVRVRLLESYARQLQPYSVPLQALKLFVVLKAGYVIKRDELNILKKAFESKLTSLNNLRLCDFSEIDDEPALLAIAEAVLKPDEAPQAPAEHANTLAGRILAVLVVRIFLDEVSIPHTRKWTAIVRHLFRSRWISLCCISPTLLDSMPDLPASDKALYKARVFDTAMATSIAQWLTPDSYFATLTSIGGHQGKFWKTRDLEAGFVVLEALSRRVGSVMSALAEYLHRFAALLEHAVVNNNKQHCIRLEGIAETFLSNLKIDSLLEWKLQLGAVIRVLRPHAVWFVVANGVGSSSISSLFGLMLYHCVGIGFREWLPPDPESSDQELARRSKEILLAFHPLFSHPGWLQLPSTSAPDAVFTPQFVNGLSLSAAELALCKRKYDISVENPSDKRVKFWKAFESPFHALRRNQFSQQELEPTDLCHYLFATQGRWTLSLNETIELICHIFRLRKCGKGKNSTEEDRNKAAGVCRSALGEEELHRLRRFDKPLGRVVLERYVSRSVLPVSTQVNELLEQANNLGLSDLLALFRGAYDLQWPLTVGRPTLGSRKSSRKTKSRMAEDESGEDFAGADGEDDLDPRSSLVDGSPRSCLLDSLAAIMLYRIVSYCRSAGRSDYDSAAVNEHKPHEELVKLLLLYYVNGWLSERDGQFWISPTVVDGLMIENNEVRSLLSDLSISADLIRPLMTQQRNQLVSKAVSGGVVGCSPLAILAVREALPFLTLPLSYEFGAGAFRESLEEWDTLDFVTHFDGATVSSPPATALFGTFVAFVNWLLSAERNLVGLGHATSTTGGENHTAKDPVGESAENVATLERAKVALQDIECEFITVSTTQSSWAPPFHSLSEMQKFGPPLELGPRDETAAEKPLQLHYGQDSVVPHLHAYLVLSLLHDAGFLQFVSENPQYLNHLVEAGWLTYGGGGKKGRSQYMTPAARDLLRQKVAEPRGKKKGSNNRRALALAMAKAEELALSVQVHSLLDDLSSADDVFGISSTASRHQYSPSSIETNPTTTNPTSTTTGSSSSTPPPPLSPLSPPRSIGEDIADSPQEIRTPGSGIGTSSGVRTSAGLSLSSQAKKQYSAPQVTVSVGEISAAGGAK